MSYNVNELDNELEMYLSRDRRAVEEWRRNEAALPAREQGACGKLLGVVRAAASRSISAVGQAASAVLAWATESSEPQEECC